MYTYNKEDFPPFDDPGYEAVFKKKYPAVTEVTLHRDQRQAIFSPKRFVYMCSGIQGGKTMGGAIWMRKRMSEIPAKNTNFLITAPSHKIMIQATLPTFLKFNHGLGKLNKSEGMFEMPNKRRLYLRTFSDGKNPRAVEGITDLEGNWNDEVGMLNLECAINLEARTSFRQCPQFNSTTPYSLNWLYKNIYKPFKEGERPDIEFIQFMSKDNPFFPKEEFDRQKKLLDPKVFAMKYEGRFERMAGLVYPDIDERNYYEVFKPNPRDWTTFGGIDFGYTDPFALSVRAMHNRDPLDIKVAEFKKSYLSTNEMINVALKFQKDWNVDMFFADSADPQSIADLSVAGVRVTAVRKGPDSIKNGILSHNALIRSKEYKLMPGACPYTEDEYATYHYPEDKGIEGQKLDLPVDANNHIMDTERYITLMTKEFRILRKEKGMPQLVKGELQRLADMDADPWETETVKDWYEL